MSWRFGTAALFFLNTAPSGSLPAYEPPTTMIDFTIVPNGDPLDAGVSWDDRPNQNVVQISQFLSQKMPDRSDWTEMAEVVVEEADKAHLEPAFVLAVMEEESGFDTKARSPVGALGLMQLMPPTFKLVMGSERVEDPIENIRAGVRYLGKMKRMFHGDEDLFLIAYNAGPGTLKDYLEDGEVPERYFDYPHEVERRHLKFKRLLASR